MRCADARAAIEEIVDANRETSPDPALRDHLNSCNSCAEYFSQFHRIWQALSAYPSVEPSPNLILRTKSRLQRNGSRTDSRFSWHVVAGWQWMTVSACIMILCAVLFLSQHTSPLVPQIDTAQIDAADDKLLQDIEQSLSQLEENGSLADYDSWSGAYLETAIQELPQAPASKPAQNGRGPL
jgi:predicted anti-sigma-YlaC factor YlaD